MATRLCEIDTVVLGRFNPHIISPPWLVNEEIVGDEGPIELGLAAVGRGVAFRFKMGDFAWQVDFNRLAISTEKLRDTAAIAAKVVEKLPHTPVTAIGNNFRYRGNLSQWQGRLPKLNDIGFERLKEFGEVQAVGWRAWISHPDELTVNAEISLEPSVESLSPAVIVNLNYHRQAGDADAVIAAAQRFAEDRKASAELMDSLFGEKVEP